MASVNKAIIVGNLGADPDMRYMPSGEAVASLSIATTDKFKNRDGEMVEQTEWHRVSFFGKTAEVCGEYLSKGSQVYIEGSIRTRKYTDKNGVEKYSTEIRGERMQMLGSRNDRDDDRRDTRRSEPRREEPRRERDEPRRDNRQPNRSAPPQRGGGSSGFDDMDDDIPFATASVARDVIWRKLRTDKD